MPFGDELGQTYRLDIIGIKGWRLLDFIFSTARGADKRTYRSPLVNHPDSNEPAVLLRISPLDRVRAVGIDCECSILFRVTENPG